MKSDAPFAAANARLRKKRIGSIGSGVRSSQATNAASRSAAPLRAQPTIGGLVQPSPFPWMRPHTIPSRPRAAEREAGDVERLVRPVLSRSSDASGSRTSPTGTFSQKIHCHEIPSTTAPPTSGPIATARPAMPDHAPSASPRCSARHGRAEDRQRERRHDRRRRSPARRGRRSATRSTARARRRRGRGEDADADHEHALAPEAIAERGAGEQEHGEREACRRSPSTRAPRSSRRGRRG